ncbi:MAG: hypothetical protein PHP35_01645 [Candidatus Colwellbacteria bacterium]|nr:hypothetical protein [Candidatus Colwellbacteria bacterium]
MKWIGISGGWRKVNSEIEEKVRENVKGIVLRGDGIVSGGALNVDYIALDEALKHNPEADRIKIFLPTTLDKYAEHYRKHARLGNITSQQAEDLVNQLSRLKEIRGSSLIENPNTDFTEENKKDRYYERNLEVVKASDELVAFHVKSELSEGLGTQDTIKKAKEKGIPVKIYEFNIS